VRLLYFVSDGHKSPKMDASVRSVEKVIDSLLADKPVNPRTIAVLNVISRLFKGELLSCTLVAYFAVCLLLVFIDTENCQINKHALFYEVRVLFDTEQMLDGYLKRIGRLLGLRRGKFRFRSGSPTNARCS
jgi:hypothetical protein